MKGRLFSVQLVCLLSLVNVGFGAGQSQRVTNADTKTGVPKAAVPLPPADAVMQRVLDRSAARADATNSAPWAYDKLTVIERLGSDGEAKERTEKLYHVRIVQGLPFTELVRIEGHELTDAEVAQENQREAAFRKQISGRDPSKDIAKRTAFITKDVMDRYDYRTLSREIIHGRKTLEVSFRAKPGQKDSSIQDRVLNRLAGTVWVDELTGDVARLDVKLTEGFSMGILGVLGALKSCQMELACIPMTDGTWLPEQTKLSLSMRMFLSNARFQMEETSSNFTLEPARPQ